MKKAIDYLIDQYGCKDLEDLEKCFLSPYDVSITMLTEAIESAQKEAYNQALIDAVKNVRITVKDVYISKIGGGDWESAPVLDESSILNLKINEKNISKSSC